MRRYFRSYSIVWELENTYFLDDLKKESENVQYHIAKLEKEKQELIDYLGEISTRAAQLFNQDYHIEIDLKRNAWRSERVTYEVLVCSVATGVKADNYNTHNKKQIEFIRFTGKERRKAIEKAQELMTKYNCKILNKNF